MPRNTIRQQEFLQDAMKKLGLNRESFAARIGCPPTTFKKWLAAEDATENYREMPAIAWALVREVLAHERLKSDHERLQKKLLQSH